MCDHSQNTGQPTEQPPAEFLQLDPGTLLTDHNIRAVRTDDAFRNLVARIGVPLRKVFIRAE